MRLETGQSESVKARSVETGAGNFRQTVIPPAAESLLKLNHSSCDVVR
jgi:hypothetical protein